MSAERIEVQTRQLSAARCPLCLEPSGQEVSCSDCEAPYHAACVDELAGSRCLLLGCRGALGAQGRAAPWALSRPALGAAAALLVAAAGLLMDAGTHGELGAEPAMWRVVLSQGLLVSALAVIWLLRPRAG